jgi:hypothetical protein
MGLAFVIISSQATRLYVTFEDAHDIPVDYSMLHDMQEYENLVSAQKDAEALACKECIERYRWAVAAQPINTEALYDHVRVTFVDGASKIDYVLSRCVARKLAPDIDGFFCPGMPIDPSSFLDLDSSHIQQIFPGLNAQVFALIVRMDAQGRDSNTFDFTQESLHRFVHAVVKDGLDAGKPVLDCVTPLRLTLILANVLGNALSSPVANQLMTLALTDEYLRMATPEDLVLVAHFKQGLYGKHPIDEAYNRLLLPHWCIEKDFWWKSAVRVVACAPDGKHLASGHTDDSICMWDVANRDRQRLHGHSSWVPAVAYSPDGKHVASGSYDTTVRIWSAETGDSEAILRGHTAEVVTVAYSPDGKHIASGSWDHNVCIWNVTTGKLENTLRGHTHSVYCVSYSPDGARVISGGRDGVICVWNARTGECEQVLPNSGHSVDALAYSPDGIHIASGSVEDGGICVWDVRLGIIEKKIGDQSLLVDSLSYSPDGMYIASGGGDKNVHIWHAATGVHEAALEGRAQWVLSVAYTPDGLHLASGSSDRFIHLWGAGKKLHKLTSLEQWHMLVQNARMRFKDRNALVNAFRMLIAARKTQKAKQTDTKDVTKKSCVSCKPVAMALVAMMRGNAPWRKVQKFFIKHKKELRSDVLLRNQVEEYIQERCTGASSSGLSLRSSSAPMSYEKDR